MKANSRRQQEKKNKEECILASAERVFGLKGYEDASMDEIAKEAQYTKRTIYQYFATKESLYLSVIAKGLNKILDLMSEENFTDQTGYDQMMHLFVLFYMYYKEYPVTFSVISKWGNTKEKITCDNNIDLELMHLNKQILSKIKASIELGKKDGSITTHLDTQMLSLSLMFLVTSFFNQLSISGESFTSYCNLDLDDFRGFILEMVLSILKK